MLGLPVEEAAANSTADPVSLLYSSLSSSEKDSIVNVTREYPVEYATVMFGRLMPIVLVVTLITNTLVVMVLTKKHMRTPTNIVLTTMAFVDLITLLSPSPWYIYIYTLGYPDKFLYPPILCYAHYIMTDVVPVFFHTSSIWLALLLASQRYIYVCHPTLARTWCTIPKVNKAIIIILVLAFAHQLTRFFDNSFVTVYIQTEQGTFPACKNEIAVWVQRLDVPTYYITYFTFRIFFVFIIPSILLITLNYLLFRALHRAENKRTELLKTKLKLMGSRRPMAGCRRNQQRLNARSTSGLQPLTGFQSSQSDLSRPSQGEHQHRLSILSFYRRRKRAKKNQAPTNLRKLEDSDLRLRSSDTAVGLESAGEKVIKAKRLIDESIITDSRSTRDSASASSASDTSGPNSSSGSSSSSRSSGLLVRDKVQTLEGDVTLEKGGAVKLGPVERQLSQEADRRRRLRSMADFGWLECAACEQSAALECRNCGAGRLHRQAGSPCSSLAGGVTNDDTSSWPAIQSPPAMCANRDCALEAGSLRAGHVYQATGDEPANKAEAGTKLELTKSISIDSRLLCDCLTPRSKSAPQYQRLRASRRRRVCPDCCTADDCRLSGYRIARKQQPADKEPSCSLSEPCIQCDLAAVIAGHQVELNMANSQSDYGNKQPEASQAAASTVETTTATATTNTTTTTTTLYSTRSANSAASLQLAVCPAGASPRHTSFFGERDLRASLVVQPEPVTLHRHGGSNSARIIDSNRTTLMLFVVITVFLMVELPAAAVTIAHVVLNTFEVFKDVELSWLNYVKLFTNFFIMISYSVNFYIYCSMSKKFRETFWDLILCGRNAKLSRGQHRLSGQLHSQVYLPVIPSNLIDQNEPTTTASQAVNSASAHRRNDSQQQECEL